MKKIKQIPVPDLPGVKELTAAELNRYRFSEGHSVLTPEMLSRMAKSQSQPAQDTL